MSDSINSSEQKKKIKFDYIKSNYFRTARADGAVGGLNGHGDIVLSFFSERPPIPKTAVHILTDKQLGDELLDERVQRDAVVREVEVCLSMNLNVAKALRSLIDKQIEQMEAIIQQGQGGTK